MVSSSTELALAFARQQSPEGLSAFESATYESAARQAERLAAAQDSIAAYHRANDLTGEWLEEMDRAEELERAQAAVVAGLPALTCDSLADAVAAARYELDVALAATATEDEIEVLRDALFDAQNAELDSLGFFNIDLSSSGVFTTLNYDRYIAPIVPAEAVAASAQRAMSVVHISDIHNYLAKSAVESWRTLLPATLGTEVASGTKGYEATRAASSVAQYLDWANVEMPTVVTPDFVVAWQTVTGLPVTLVGAGSTASNVFEALTAFDLLHEASHLQLIDDDRLGALYTYVFNRWSSDEQLLGLHAVGRALLLARWHAPAGRSWAPLATPAGVAPGPDSQVAVTMPIAANAPNPATGFATELQLAA